MDERRMTNEQRERERRDGEEQEKDVAVSETCVLHCW